VDETFLLMLSLVKEIDLGNYSYIDFGNYETLRVLRERFESELKSKLDVQTL
jgi:hypothetical protein